MYFCIWCAPTRVKTALKQLLIPAGTNLTDNKEEAKGHNTKDNGSSSAAPIHVAFSGYKGM